MENKEIALENLFDLYLFICSLKMNKKTKTPSVNITQEQAMELLAQLNSIALCLGKSFKLTNEDGSVVVRMEDIRDEEG